MADKAAISCFASQKLHQLANWVYVAKWSMLVGGWVHEMNVNTMTREEQLLLTVLVSDSPPAHRK